MIDSLQRYPHSHPRAVNAVVVTSLFACSFPGSLVTVPGHDLDVPWWPGVLLTGVACAALLGRRGRPRTTVVLTGLCALAVAALGYIPTVLLLGPLMVALYSLATGTTRRTAYTFSFTAIAALATTGLLAGPGDVSVVLKLIGPAAWLLLPTALGNARRLYVAYLEAVQARAEHAERTREEEARRRVTEERMRIARDLHDVVAHHLVLANLQASTVARLLRTQLDEAARISTDLSESTSVALSELKATVGLLRSADTADSTDNAPGPAPGLARLPDLVDSFRSAGLTVTVITEGDPGPLGARTDLTAYRILQEALTNVTKHAGTHAAEVRIAYTGDRLRVTITNGGAAESPAPGSGFGLLGMRERARSVGGHLRAGHRREGGFEVVTDLPLHPSEAVGAARRSAT